MTPILSELRWAYLGAALWAANDLIDTARLHDTFGIVCSAAGTFAFAMAFVAACLRRIA